MLKVFLRTFQTWILFYSKKAGILCRTSVGILSNLWRVSLVCVCVCFLSCLSPCSPHFWDVVGLDLKFLIHNSFVDWNCTFPKNEVSTTFWFGGLLTRSTSMNNLIQASLVKANFAAGFYELVFVIVQFAWTALGHSANTNGSTNNGRTKYQWRFG